MSTNDSNRASFAMVVAGTVALLVAIAASGMLVYAHFSHAALPGCGEGSGCADLTAGPWGKIPGIGLPVSFLGLGWFVAALAGWFACNGAVSSPYRWLVRLGAAASIFFTVIMVMKGLCIYCTASHVGNLAFWVLVELAAKGGSVAAARQPALVAGTFVVAVLGLFGGDLAWSRLIESREEDQLAQAQQQIIDNTQNAVPGEPFVGRYTQGPDEAKIRIVIYSDYQCPDCRAIELQVRQIMEERDDVLFSAKHFPMTGQCNPYISGNGPHPNACWAARAAETAGMIRGEAGFWEMHHVLFDRKGSFTGPELQEVLRGLEYDVSEFLQIMQSQEPLDLVLEDIEEAKTLGLHFTPMIFVNGVELKGFRAPNALINTVMKVVATDPPAATVEMDQPPSALQKHIDDWVAQTARPIKGLEDRIGRGDGPVEVTVWGDISNKFTATIDEAVRRGTDGRDDVTFRFVHYPLSKACNPSSQMDRSPLGCVAAQALIAAGRLGGPDAHWAMYDWFVANHETLSEDGIVAAAAELGIDPDALRAEMASPEVAAAIIADARLGAMSGVGRFIPTVYVNRKWVPRWRLDDNDVLGMILDLAAE